MKAEPTWWSCVWLSILLYARISCSYLCRYQPRPLLHNLHTVMHHVKWQLEILDALYIFIGIYCCFATCSVGQLVIVFGMFDRCPIDCYASQWCSLLVDFFLVVWRLFVVSIYNTDLLLVMGSKWCWMCWYFLNVLYLQCISFLVHMYSAANLILHWPRR